MFVLLQLFEKKSLHILITVLHCCSNIKNDVNAVYFLVLLNYSLLINYEVCFCLQCFCFFIHVCAFELRIYNIEDTIENLVCMFKYNKYCSVLNIHAVALNQFLNNLKHQQIL